MTDRPRGGDVWRYPYLWAWQSARGEADGRKPRPTAVAVTMFRKDGKTRLVLLAITSQEPDNDRTAMEVPDTEKRRAGLESDTRLWIILDEFNADIIEDSWYLEPDARIGRFAGPFLIQVQRAFRDRVAEGGATAIDRTKGD